MSDRHDLLAYLATLAALVIVFVAALAFAANYPEIIGKLEAFGLGTITGGLIGVLRIPSAQPIATTQAGDVNVLPSPQPDNPVPVDFGNESPKPEADL